MLTSILIFLSFLNLLSIGASFYRWYQIKSRQQQEADTFADFANKQQEAITKAVELNNAYCNALQTVLERAGSTEEEDELHNEVNKRQKTFLYHLRKLNPDYTIIKNQ